MLWLIQREKKKDESHHEKTQYFDNGITKSQISFKVTEKLISIFVLATGIVQLLFYFNAKLLASCLILWLYIPVCVGPGRKPHCFPSCGSDIDWVLICAFLETGQVFCSIYWIFIIRGARSFLLNSRNSMIWVKVKIALPIRPF